MAPINRNSLKRMLHIAALSASLAIGLEAQAQRPARTQTPPQTAVALIVIRVGALSDATAVAEIVRRSSGEDRNVILVSDVTTARDLAMAIRSFRMMRERIGDDLSKELRGVIQPAPSQLQFLPAELERAESILRGLDTSRSRTLNGIGSGRATTVTVQALASRRKNSP